MSLLRVGPAGSTAVPVALLIALTALISFSVGQVTATSATLGIAALVGCAAVVVLLRTPVLAAVAALLAVFAIQRLGAATVSSASSGVSYSDAALAGAAVLAFPALLRSTELKRLRAPLIGFACYATLLLPSVILNQNRRADMEFAHRTVLIAGAMLVGAWIVQGRCVRPAVLALIALGSALGVAVFLDMAAHGFSIHHSALGYNKNYVGAILSNVLIIVFILGRWLRMRPGLQYAAALAVGSGALAVLSRGSYVGAIVGLLVAAVAGGMTHGRATRIVGGIVVIILGIVVYSTVKSQFAVSHADFKLNSIGVRASVEQTTQEIWRTSPIIGVGMRYFIGGQGQFGSFATASNNLLNNELAESGLVGLVGFLILHVSILGALWGRRGHPVGLCALAVAVSTITHGMVDIYWQAGTIALMFILVGMGVSSAEPGRARVTTPAGTAS